MKKNDTLQKKEQKKEWKHTKGWSLDPYFMTLLALYMNSLAPK